MRRIGHLVAAPRVLGGVGTAVEGLVEASARHGVDASTVLAVTTDAPPTRASGTLAALLHLPLRQRPDLDLSVRDLDGLVVHGVFHPGVARAVRYVQDRYPRLPVVAFPHDAYDDGLFEQRRLIKSAYFSAVERPRLRATRAVITTAPSHELWLRRRGVDNPVHCAPLGLSAHDLASAARVRRGARATPRQGPHRLLFVGRWNVHEKGLDLALDAVARLPRGAATLRVVGPTLGQEHQLARLAAAAGGEVELVGYVPDVWEELAAADLLLMPSRKEGFGIAGLQALAAGVPVLLSRRAGLVDHVTRQDGVIVVDPTPRGVRGGLEAALDCLPQLEEAAVAYARGPGPGPGWSYEGLCQAVLNALDEPLPVR